ncbi:MAG: TrkA family potassium uptake protein [Oscillospiraceae bacterium]|nr:TrkA family potassium uptake protein [Oscillospiraceae bacterium]
MKTFAVIGLGRFGTAVAAQLFNMGYEVLAVDKNMDKVNVISDNVTKAVCGDAREESVLKAVGIRNYDCAVVAIGDDLADSVLITLALKEMGVGQIICKARDNRHKKVLKKIGADNVIIPEQEAGIKTAVSLVSKRVMDLIDLSDEYGIADITAPKSWVGRSIEELSIRRKYGVNIIAVKNRLDDNDVNIAPKSDYKFKETDIIVLVGETAEINRLNNM